MQVNDTLAQVIAQVIAKNAPKEKQAPGEYKVKGLALVEIDATVTKGEPEVYLPTASLPLKQILAIALQKAGVQRENIAKIIVEAATEALQTNGKVVYEEATEEALKRVDDALLKLPAKTREGKTKINGNCRIVDLIEMPERVYQILQTND